ncbi:hypothetical protein ACVWZK_001826 [Bradyrhizobium sp. GM0.4]
MPGMTGLQLAGAVAAERPGTVILLSTGYAEIPSNETIQPAAFIKAIRPGCVGEGNRGGNARRRAKRIHRRFSAEERVKAG